MFVLNLCSKLELLISKIKEQQQQKKFSNKFLSHLLIYTFRDDSFAMIHSE